jgi:hypothetical protein
MKPEAARRVVAYLEAGHAVVARLLGVDIVSVTMAEEAGVLRPSAAYAARESGTAAQVVGYEIDGKIALAGPIAQLMSRPRPRSTSIGISRGGFCECWKCGGSHRSA